MKEKINEIKQIEGRRLREFPLYEQTEFKIINTLVYVKLERKRKPSEPKTILKKVAEIIYDTEKENKHFSLLNTLEGSIKSHKKAYFLLTNDSIQEEFESEDFEKFKAFIR
jgi:diphthamide synthase subunit DPH2